MMSDTDVSVEICIFLCDQLSLHFWFYTEGFFVQGQTVFSKLDCCCYVVLLLARLTQFISNGYQNTLEVRFVGMY